MDWSDVCTGVCGSGAGNSGCRDDNEINDVFDELEETGYPFSPVTSCGDAFSVNGADTVYDGKTKTITDAIRGAGALNDSDIPVNYVWSDHDRCALQDDGTTLLDKTSRLVYGAGNDGEYGTDDDANYYVYALSMGDICSYDRYSAGFNYAEGNYSSRAAAGFTSTVDQAIQNFKNDAATLKKDRPLFIASHQPLLDNRNDNAWAEDWFDAINKVAEEMDVAFFFGHNHKYDNVDTSTYGYTDYYFPKGSTMPVATADNWGFRYETGAGYQGYLPSMDLISEDKKLNFTHMCTGYLEPTSTGKQNNTVRTGTAVAVTICEDSISYVTYNKDGVYTGKYALNVTVPRDHAAAVTPVTPVEKTDVATGVSVTASGITGLTVENKTPASVPEGYTAYLTYDINVAGFTAGTTATVTVPVPETSGFDLTKPVVVLYDGDVIATTSIVDNTVTFTTTHFTEYTIAQRATVGEKEVKSVGVSPMEITVVRNSSMDKIVGTVSVTYGDDTTEEIPLTLRMLKEQNEGLSLGESGTYNGLEFTYAGKTVSDITVTVISITATDDYPTYPNPGSVNIDKTATGHEFQETGLATVELSASGLPYAQGVDVIVMLDMSSSMDRCTTCGEYLHKYSNKTKECTCGTNVTRVVELADAMQALEDALKNSPNADNIRIAVADFNGYYKSGPYAYNTSDRTQDIQGLTNAADTQIYTGSSLDASAFIPASELDVSTFNYGDSCSSGTNYDYAFDAIYQLGHSIKKQNESNGLERELFVLFMSDGAPNQYNYYHTTGGSGGSYDWNYWLTGAIGKQVGEFDGTNLEMKDIVNNSAHYHYYNEEKDNQHRMANAVKGDPDLRYEVIRKATTGLADVLDATGESEMYTIPGLGATMYSIAFYVTDDGQIKQSAAQHVLTNIPTSTDHYVDAAKQGELAEAFARIGGEIAYAATNARFVDEMGPRYDLQMSSTFTRASDSTVFETRAYGVEPHIEVKSYAIWTQADYQNNDCTLDDIGKRKTRTVNGQVEYIYTVIETITFNADGTEAYSTVNGTTSGNILKNGIICAQNFWYNTGTSAQKIDLKGDTTGSGDDYNLSGETFYWKLGTINLSELAISYLVCLEKAMTGEDAGSYATNKRAVLFYDNYLGHPCQLEAVSPQMAWQAAGFSYAFYFVNAAGDPVNLDGEVVNFQNRVTVTSPEWYQTLHLNEIQGDATAALHILANNQGILPEGYYLFDEGATYTLSVNSDASGSWDITSTKDRHTTYVTGHSPIEQHTNKLHADGYDGYDFTHTTVWFAITLEPKAVNDEIVIDYGLPVNINVLGNDLFGSKGTLTGVAEKTANLTQGTLANAITTTSVGYEDGFGNAMVVGNVIRYTPNTSNGMQMNKAETFTYSVYYENALIKDKPLYYYADVTVIPATIIYYEEKFVTFAPVDKWIPEGSEDPDASQSNDRPGNANLIYAPNIDANNIYGYDPAYSNYTQYSLGRAMKVTVDAESGKPSNAPTATFTFSGKGFDIVSLTDYDSGLIMVTVKDEAGNIVNDKDGKPVNARRVDNYYGYAYCTANVKSYAKDASASYNADTKKIEIKQNNKIVESYDYAGVNVLYNDVECYVVENPSDKGTYLVLVKEDKMDDSVTSVDFWIPKDNASSEQNNRIYQVPVMKIALAKYGVYTVTVQVGYMRGADHVGDGSYSFWMDAVRIYDPANGGAADGTDDTTIEDAYKADHEYDPHYLMIRNAILSKEATDSLISSEDGVFVKDDVLTGTVFIDGRADTSVVSDYENPGPNNEAYLAGAQGISFKLKSSVKPDKVHLGAKLAFGSDAPIKVVSSSLNDGETVQGTVYTGILETMTDMYYDITEFVHWNGEGPYVSDTITISNTNPADSDNSVISLTNLKVTYPVPESEESQEERANQTFTLRRSTDEPEETTVEFIVDAEVLANGVAVMNALGAEEVPEVFTPELFEADYSSNRNGKNVTVTVTASTDVEVITINGIEMSRYKEKKGVRTWTYKPKNNELADLYEIVAFNADGLASEPIYAGSENTDDLLTAEADSSMMSQKVVNKLQKNMEKLANRIFTPEKFTKKLEKLADGAELMIVNTSEDVEYIIADGEILRNYITETIIDLSKDGEETVNRVWLVPNADDNAEIAAYNAEGVASEVQNND